MSETARDVFAKYEIRKTKRQKTAFIQYVSSVADAEGYGCRVEKGYLGARNIVVGNPDTAKVVYTAHYDTCAVMPFPNFITPKCIWGYLLYQILITVVLLAIPTLAVAAIGGIGLLLSPYLTIGLMVGFGLTFCLWYFFLLLEMYLLLAGPANKHTANDNTSGVITLLSAMKSMPPDLRDKVAFVFFDLEETGLWGSAGFASKHPTLRKSTLLVNFDCVSDGTHFLFVTGKGSIPYESHLKAAFPCTEKYTAEVASKGVIYPSDQANFLRGVGVAALKKTKRGTLYMDRIHTGKDVIYDEENIAYLSEGAVRLAQRLTEAKE